MSETMRPLPFDNLMRCALSEFHRGGTVFGVGAIFRAAHERPLSLFRERLETPFGPAAGPHTQMAQNIVAGYAAGARFFELKTVQIMDGEALAKCIQRPCILAADEGYNCEWSTELTVPQAQEEYVKAWWALKLLSRELGLGGADGFVFNMSVGYDLAGIRSEKIDGFIEGLRGGTSCAAWDACRDWALENLGLFRHVDRAYVEAVGRRVSESITLSTLHGCPPDEIERIAGYLIGEKRLHTFIKCNPTLLGYDFARKTLDALGFDYVAFGDFHFQDDLPYADAVPMLRRLTALAAENGVEFGVKLTNTFPVDVRAGELPSEEMYMSGRSLFPLVTELARRLSAEFQGTLRISYSGGADIHNIAALCGAGIWPVTMATTLLKPGGYSRLKQIAETLAGKTASFTGVDTAAVAAIAADALTDSWYRKPFKPVPNRKLDTAVPLLGCFTAPCRDGCPIGQDIPAYVALLGEGKTLDALRVITRRNPLPSLTGEICPHRCMDKCVRNYYEGPVDIRGAKRESALAAFDELCAELAPPVPAEKSASIVGGGPAGLSAAYFLARQGWAVTVFEKEAEPGGIPLYVIPDFRVSPETVRRDAALCRALGVRFETGCAVASLDGFDDFDAVFLAAGAHKAGQSPLRYGACLDALPFLRACKEGAAPPLGERVAVIGGGNTAMDTARVALRAPGVKRVSLVYRRTKRWMPADEEELAAALADGAVFCELLAPVGVRDGVLYCQKMALGPPDESGRRTPVATDETAEVPADTVIAAVGEGVDAAFYERLGLALDEKGRPVLNPATGESSLSGVYVIGDGARGPRTVVEAIADATRAVRAAAGDDFELYTDLNRMGDGRPARRKKGVFCGDCPEAERCLECATVCELCVDVCPNRANISVEVDGTRQIVHLDGLCNECGNCAVFCPYDAAPYREKLTVYRTAADFEGDGNPGALPLPDGRWRVRLKGVTTDCDLNAGGVLPTDVADVLRAFKKQNPTLAFS